MCRTGVTGADRTWNEWHESTKEDAEHDLAAAIEPQSLCHAAHLVAAVARAQSACADADADADTDAMAHPQNI